MSGNGVNRGNLYNRDVLVYVTGGTVTAIGVNGTNTGLFTGVFLLKANDYITLTYSAAPSWLWYGA